MHICKAEANHSYPSSYAFSNSCVGGGGWGEEFIVQYRRYFQSFTRCAVHTPVPIYSES